MLAVKCAATGIPAGGEQRQPSGIDAARHDRGSGMGSGSIKCTVTEIVEIVSPRSGSIKCTVTVIYALSP